MMNKFALKELEMLKLLAAKAPKNEAYAAARRFVGKAPDLEGARQARIEAVARFLPGFKG